MFDGKSNKHPHIGINLPLTTKYKKSHLFILFIIKTNMFTTAYALISGILDVPKD